MPIIGGHVSASVSLELSFERAQNIGAQATQIFISPPQMWIQSKHSDEEVAAYKTKSKETGITQNFIHGAYLVNLATDKPENLEKSIKWLTWSQNTAYKLGIKGTIFHVGSGRERTFEQVVDQVVEAIKRILADSPEVDLILENSAGAGNTVGDTIEELGEIITKVGDPRVKVCLDTQHLFASGYDQRSEAAVNNIVNTFDEVVGLDKLVAFHCNDSKTELGSHRDRHENIGEGLIGKEAFGWWVNHPKLQNVPFILEVPGIDDNGPDEENINRLKSLVK